MQYTALLALATALAAGEAFAAFEDRSAGNGVYWALTTMTTVGSDLFPTTTASKMLAVALALVGVSFVAILTGAIAQRFLAPEVEREVEEVEEELDATTQTMLRELGGVRAQLDRIEAALRRGMDRS